MAEVKFEVSMKILGLLRWLEEFTGAPSADIRDGDKARKAVEAYLEEAGISDSIIKEHVNYVRVDGRTLLVGVTGWGEDFKSVCQALKSLASKSR